MAVFVAFRMMQVQAFKVGAKTHKVSGEVEEEMKKEEDILKKKGRQKKI